MSIRAKILNPGRIHHNPSCSENEGWFLLGWHMEGGLDVKPVDYDNAKLSGWPFRELLIIAHVAKTLGRVAALDLADHLRFLDETAHVSRQDKINDLQRQIDELKEDAR